MFNNAMKPQEGSQEAGNQELHRIAYENQLAALFSHLKSPTNMPKAMVQTLIDRALGEDRKGSQLDPADRVLIDFAAEAMSTPIPGLILNNETAKIFAARVEKRGPLSDASRRLNELQKSMQTKVYKASSWDELMDMG